MDYLDWKSNLSLEQVFSETAGFTHPSLLDDGSILYLTKSSKDNRSVLMLVTKKKERCVTPSPFNLQTRVNEYGGKPFWVFGTSILFANASDQCLYYQERTAIGLSDPIRISCEPSDTSRFMYTDVQNLGSSNYLAIIEFECSQISHSNNSMFIGAITRDVQRDPIRLVEGADFYSNLCVNRDCSQVAWVQWSHPNMPWDPCELWIADLRCLDGVPTFENAHRIDVVDQGVRAASVCQLTFANNGRLFFSADFPGMSDADARNFWNIHCYDFSQQRLSRVTAEQREYGYPHWVYGDCRIVQFTDTKLLTIASAPSGDELILINQDNLAYSGLSVGLKKCTLQHLDSNSRGDCVLVKLPFDANPSLLELQDQSSRDPTVLTIREPNSIDSDTSCAEEVTFATVDGNTSHGFYYPPVNSACQRATFASALPPLLVMVHGGPTARAYAHFDLQKQFWTSRGFAILDVNHRGSSGYGRNYRDSLYGQWGEIDASDIADGVGYLIGQNKVDPNRVCIRGKSAGGYAVLRMLTEYPDMFKVGACYYGIGNLVTLADTTHKFEKYYTDRLIGEIYNEYSAKSTQSKFFQRSPINKISQLSSAMIVFQGGIDRVVPPSVANEIVEALARAGIDHEYVEYANEGHGFKRSENNIDAWTKELEFYKRVLNA